MPAPRVAVIVGKGRACPPAVRTLATRTGLALAQLHPRVVLVNGGLGGVMDASAKGMTAGGGVAIGLIPTPARYVSPHLTYAIPLGLPVQLRDITTAQAADVMIVLPGSHGTMIEGWAAADRGVPLLAVGCHHGRPTAELPYLTTATPLDLAAIVARVLRLPSVG
jgi:hypothetical protein